MDQTVDMTKRQDITTWILRLGFLWAMLSIIGACSVDVPEGLYQCDLDGPRGCPTGWVCSLRPDDQVPRCYKEMQQTCGNALREADEECDGTDLGDKTCANGHGHLSQGTAICRSDCTIDWSDCHQCGNGHIEGGEDCDGVNVGGATCQEVTQKPDGVVTCTADCTFDTSGCSACGDGLVEGAEDCDGTELNGKSCIDLNMDGGTLGCSDSCRFDQTNCFTCGDGVCSSALGETRQTCPAECGWQEAAAGGYHTCGLRGDGLALCWGSNSNGQLGDGTTTSEATPVVVIDLQGAVRVLAAGKQHTCAALDDGTVWCWGDNASGQLGSPASAFTETATPVQVPGLSGVSDVSAGDAFSCALDGNGAVWCWGDNMHGELGDGTGTSSASPVQAVLSGSNTATDIAAGRQHVCAVQSDGAVWCWGDNSSGQLGDGTHNQSLTPVRVTGLSDATALSVAAGEAHSCALLDDGHVRCWGSNSSGELGVGSTVPQTGVAVTHLTGHIVDLSVGWSFSCAMTDLGSAWCWGSNGNGRLGAGEGVGTSSATPLAVLVIEDGTSLSAGGTHACGVQSNGIMWCWGGNSDGQLGQGATSTTDSATPVRVLEPAENH